MIITVAKNGSNQPMAHLGQTGTIRAYITPQNLRRTSPCYLTANRSCENTSTLRPKKLYMTKNYSRNHLLSSRASTPEAKTYVQSANFTTKFQLVLRQVLA